MKRLILAVLLLAAPSYAQFNNSQKFWSLPIEKPTQAADGKIYALDWTNRRFTLIAASGSGTVTSVVIAGTANQITVAGTCTITATGTCTISLPSVITLPGTINKLTLTPPATAATLTLANNSSLITVGAFAGTLTFTATTNATFPAGTKTLVPTDVTTLSSLATISSALTGVLKASSGVLSVVSGSASDCVLVDGTSSACGSGTSYTAGNGLTLTVAAFSINTTITMDLPSAQAVAGVKSFNANTLVLTPGADSGTTAGAVNINGSGQLNYYSSARRLVYSTTGTPCTATQVVIGSATATLTGCANETGTGSVVLASAPTISLPVIGDFTNANHDHSNAAGGGTLAKGAIPNINVLISTSGAVSDPGYSSDFQYNNAAGALTFNAPAGVAGLQRCYRNATGKSGVVTIQMASSNTVDLDGANGSSAGTLVSGGALGDAACIVSDAANHWYAYVQKGSWTNN